MEHLYSAPFFTEKSSDRTLTWWKYPISPKCLNSKQLQTLCVRTSQLLEHTKAPTILRVKNLAHRVKALDYTWLLNTEFKSWIQAGFGRVFKFSISCSGKYWLLHLFLIWSNLQIGRIKAAHNPSQLALACEEPPSKLLSKRTENVVGTQKEHHDACLSVAVSLY